MKKILLLLTLALSLASCSKNAASEADATQSTPNGEVNVATQADATKFTPNGEVNELTSDQVYTPDCEVPNLTVLDFNAVWCGPCRQLTPVLRQLAEEYEGRVTFISADVDKFPQLFMDFNVGEAIPAVVILSPDGSRSVYVGLGELMPIENFRAIIDSKL